MGRHSISGPVLTIAVKEGAGFDFLSYAYLMESSDTQTLLAKLTKAQVKIEPSSGKSKLREFCWPPLVTADL